MSWRIIPLLMLVVALAHFNRISITVAGAEQIIRPGFISETEMGVVYSSFLLLYTLFMVPGGWFADRFGPRVAWMVLGFGSAFGVALTGLVGLACTQAIPLLVGLVAVRSLLGMTNAPLHPSGARLVANWVPPGGVAFANGLVNAAACVGIASTYLLFGLLIDRFGWPRAFLVASGVTLLTALVWLLAASNYPSESARTAAERVAAVSSLPRPSPFLALLGNPSLLCLTLSYGAVGYFEYLFFYWAEFYFEKVLHLPKESGRWHSSVLTLAMGAGMAGGGWLADRAVAQVGSRRGLAVVPVGGLLVGAVATIAGALASTPNRIFLSFALAMTAVGSVEGSYWTASVRIGGAKGGTAAGILNTGGNAGGLLAPIVTPALAELFGWQVGLGVASAVCLVGALLWWGVALTDEGDHANAAAKS